MFTAVAKKLLRITLLLRAATDRIYFKPKAKSLENVWEQFSFSKMSALWETFSKDFDLSGRVAINPLLPDAH